MSERRIALLGGGGESTRIVYHALRERFGDVVAFIEDPIPRRDVLRRRLRRLGARTVIGQTMYRFLVHPVLVRSARDRARELLAEHRLDNRAIPAADLIRVTSVNADETRAKLRAYAPAVVVINGTRILGKETIGCIDAPFVNTHAGITPSYRGVAGGWWALAEGRPDLAGTTVHIVDKGIDTGPILKQAVFSVTARDNAITYNYLHLAVGVPILIEAVDELLRGVRRPRLVASDVPSTLRFQYTIWDYLRARLARNVR